MQPKMSVQKLQVQKACSSMQPIYLLDEAKGLSQGSTNQ